MADYGYTNARLRAMKSHLLSTEDYHELLAHDTFSELVSAFVETPYKSEIEAAVMRYGSQPGRLMEALSTNLGRTLRKVSTFFDGPPQQLVRILLARWDRLNIVTMLRGQAREVPHGEIAETLVPAGALDEVTLHEMARQPDVRTTVDLMATWGIPYASPLTEAMPLYAESGDLAVLEWALNRFHYAHLLSQLQGNAYNVRLVREMIQLEIDTINIMTALRIYRWEFDQARVDELLARYGVRQWSELLFIAGGSMSPHILTSLEPSHTAEDVVERLRSSPYGQALSVGLDEYLLNLNAPAVQRQIERLVVRRGVDMFYRDPLTIAVAIGYIWAKENEVANLRFILQGKALGLEEQEIEKLLIMV